MKMYGLSGGRLRMKKHVFIPDAPREETIDLPVSCYLFRHAHGNVLFDTGCHPSVAEDPHARWGGLAQAIVPTMRKDDNVVSELRRLRLTPDDIDIVVNSHLHCDHCGCNEFFSNATIYVHADELARARNPAAEGRGYFQADWNHPLPMVEVSDEVDIFGDGRIVLLPFPGHTPGLTGLLATLPNSGAYLLASDAVPIKETLALKTIPKNTWNTEMLAHSLAEIERIEKSGAMVVFGHDLEQWTGLTAARQFYD